MKFFRHVKLKTLHKFTIVEIKKFPHKNSDANIGLSVFLYKEKDKIYGNWLILAYYGKYALYVTAKSIKFVNIFATGCGGWKKIFIRLTRMRFYVIMDKERGNKKKLAFFWKLQYNNNR